MSDNFFHYEKNIQKENEAGRALNSPARLFMPRELAEGLTNEERCELARLLLREADWHE